MENIDEMIDSTDAMLIAALAAEEFSALTFGGAMPHELKKGATVLYAAIMARVVAKLPPGEGLDYLRESIAKVKPVAERIRESYEGKKQ